MRRSLLLAPLVVVVMTACGDDDDDAVADSVPVPTARPVETVPATTSDPPAPTVGSSAPSPGSLRPVPGAVSPVTGPSTSPGATTGPRGTAEELAALDDLARRQGVDTGAITVVSTEEVTWRDGSMGCPQPGVNYTQALVPGIRVVLEIDGVRYEYHAGGARSIFLCEDPRAPFEG